MQKPNPEPIDDENPEWTEDTFASAVPFSALPPALQELLNSPKKIVPDVDPSKNQPAA